MSDTRDVQTDSVEQFAADLRRVRLDAGSPTLARLQSESGISKSVLSEAFSGKQLPSARTVAAIARACDVDPEHLLARRDALAAPKTESAARTGPTRPIARSTAIWIAAASFVGGVVASVATVAILAPALLPTTPAEAASSAQIVVETGEDPAATACVDDARVATGDTRADNSLLEIVWSDKCQAGWGRITRYDGQYQGNTVTIAIYPQTAADGPDRQEATEHDVQGAYTTLVVRPTPDTLLCAEGSFTVDGARIDLGDPLCI